MEPDDLSVLAQRAVADSPRWTRAVEDQSGPIPKEGTSKLGVSMYIVRCAQSRATLTTPLLIQWDGKEKLSILSASFPSAAAVIRMNAMRTTQLVSWLRQKGLQKFGQCAKW